MEINRLPKVLVPIKIEQGNRQDTLTGILFKYGQDQHYLVTVKACIPNPPHITFTIPTLAFHEQKYTRATVRHQYAGNKYDTDRNDLIAIRIDSCLDSIYKNKCEVAADWIGAEDLIDPDRCENIMDVLCVGYPNLLWDQANHYPLIEPGITTTPLQFRYDGEPKFLVSGNSHHNNFGSAVFALHEGTYKFAGILNKNQQFYYRNTSSANSGLIEAIPSMELDTLLSHFKLL